MVEVKVCIGTSCHLHGSYNVMMSFKQSRGRLIHKDDFRLYCQSSRDAESLLLPAGESQSTLI